MCKMSPEAKERAMRNRRPPFEIVVLALVLAAACGGAGPANRPIAVLESERQGLTWFAIDALPATCVRLALEKLLPERPDLVVSGINWGENLGTVTFYSAHVGAAREAAFLGIPALAVNLARREGTGAGG